LCFVFVRRAIYAALYASLVYVVVLLPDVTC